MIVQLASLPLPVGYFPLPGPASIALESIPSLTSRGPGSIFANVSMPLPGTSYMDAIGSPAGSFFARIIIHVALDQVSINVGPIDEFDIVSIMGGLAPIPGNRDGRLGNVFSGMVVHSRTAQDRRCDVTCAVSELIADECCVICTRGNTTVKFCC